MTIDLLDVDLRGVFEAGMTYVALSRGVALESNVFTELLYTRSNHKQEVRERECNYRIESFDSTNKPHYLEQVL